MSTEDFIVAASLDPSQDRLRSNVKRASRPTAKQWVRRLQTATRMQNKATRDGRSAEAKRLLAFRRRYKRRIAAWEAANGPVDQAVSDESESSDRDSGGDSVAQSQGNQVDKEVEDQVDEEEEDETSSEESQELVRRRRRARGRKRRRSPSPRSRRSRRRSRARQRAVTHRTRKRRKLSRQREAHSESGSDESFPQRTSALRPASSKGWRQAAKRGKFVAAETVLEERFVGLSLLNGTVRAAGAGEKKYGLADYLGAIFAIAEVMIRARRTTVEESWKFVDILLTKTRMGFVHSSVIRFAEAARFQAHQMGTSWVSATAEAGLASLLIRRQQPPAWRRQGPASEPTNRPMAQRGQDRFRPPRGPAPARYRQGPRGPTRFEKAFE